MSGKPSARMLQAMKLIRAGKVTPYAAAKIVKLSFSSIYRSTLYQNWRDGKESK